MKNDFDMIGGIPKVEIIYRLKEMKYKFYKNLPKFFVILIVIFVFVSINSYSKIDIVQIDNTNTEQEYLELKYSETINSLYFTIDEYINNITTNHNLDIYHIINLCEKNNYDIVFLLAQAQLESHFGTKGEARKTKSMFNVIWCKYNNVNDSVEPYIELINRKYLSNGRTSKDLLKNFTDIYNHRYAEDPLYEKKLTNIYNKIITNTSITNLFKTLQDINIEKNNINI